MRKFYPFIAIVMVLLSNSINAQQSSFDKIYHILNANCTGSGCHGDGSPGGQQSGLDFTLSDTEVYNQIINKIPDNPAAAAKGNLVIDPGYPARSYLLRKIANCSDADLALDPNEGERMPNEGNGRPALVDSSMELVRQWIYSGAPETGVVVDTATIAAYYGGPHMPRITPPAPPDPCQGYQIHLGPLFFTPNGTPNAQLEYFLRYDIGNKDSVEVRGLDCYMSAESHHFIIRKFLPGTASGINQGLILLTPELFMDQNMIYIMAWQANRNIELPNGTAYRWEPNASIDLDYHVDNYDSLNLGAEVYINVWTQPAGTSQIEMKASLINNLNIPINPGPDTINMNINPNGNPSSGIPSLDISLWSVTSHTHKFGVGYDVWLQNNGTIGDQIFNGDYDFYYTFNEGFYNWSHPPTHFITPFLYLKDPQSNGSAVTGLYEKAEWDNTGDTSVHFGFTTNDEMMIIYIQYVDGQFTIPEQGYINPSCPATPYVSPCDIPAVSDTNMLRPGEVIIGRGGDTTKLTGSNLATVNLGDTITLITNDSVFTFVVTGNYDSLGPFQFGNGDILISSDTGTVFLDGAPFAYQINSEAITGISNPHMMAAFNVFPNPFEQQTNIQYSLLSTNATVSLEVYDLLGRQVSILADNEQQQAGAHSYNYAPGDTGSGVYFVKLTVNGIITVKKIAVL